MPRVKERRMINPTGSRYFKVIDLCVEVFVIKPVIQYIGIFVLILILLIIEQVCGEQKSSCISA